MTFHLGSIRLQELLKWLPNTVEQCWDTSKQKISICFGAIAVIGFAVLHPIVFMRFVHTSALVLISYLSCDILTPGGYTLYASFFCFIVESLWLISKLVSVLRGILLFLAQLVTFAIKMTVLLAMVPFSILAWLFNVGVLLPASLANMAIFLAHNLVVVPLSWICRLLYLVVVPLLFDLLVVIFVVTVLLCVLKATESWRKFKGQLKSSLAKDNQIGDLAFRKTTMERSKEQSKRGIGPKETFDSKSILAKDNLQIRDITCNSAMQKSKEQKFFERKSTPSTMERSKEQSKRGIGPKEDFDFRSILAKDNLQIRDITCNSTMLKSKEQKFFERKSTPSEDPICGFFDSDLAHIPERFLGQGTDEARSVNHRGTLPYQWQHRNRLYAKWESFSEVDNENIERLYCSPSNSDNVKVQLCQSTTPAMLDFENMTIRWPVDISFRLTAAATDVRRLSSYGSSLATMWTWYWQDENSMWNAYGGGSWENKTVQQGIESAFVDQSCKVYDYNTTRNQYVLHFRENPMYQRNLRYNTKRMVRRRPEFRPKDEIQQPMPKGGRQKQLLPRHSQDDGKKGLPATWSPMQPGKDFDLVKLASYSEEFCAVERQFRLTMPKNQTAVVKIERVQNPFMWKKFNTKKESMQTKCREKVLEKELFHGTSSTLIGNICKQNFDWRLCGTHGTKYGQGSYFATKASYSDNYSKKDGHDSNRFMFLAKVLVGSYVKGDSTMRRPPPKNPSDSLSDLFDSTVNNQKKPRIFVVYDIDQCYPSHVIEYRPVLLT